MIPIDDETVTLVDRITATRTPGRPLPLQRANGIWPRRFECWALTSARRRMVMRIGWGRGEALWARF